MGSHGKSKKKRNITQASHAHTQIGEGDKRETSSIYPRIISLCYCNTLRNANTDLYLVVTMAAQEQVTMVTNSHGNDTHGVRSAETCVVHFVQYK